MNQPNEIDKQQWRDIMDIGKEVAAAHILLLKRTGVLAAKLDWFCDEGDIIREVLPLKADDRHNSRRIESYLDVNAHKILTGIVARREREEFETKKTALLGRLGLTDDEKALLGIDNKPRNS